MTPDDDSGLVYSTGIGRIHPDKHKPQTTNPLAHDGIVRVSRETKGRKGKGVTLVTGLGLYGEKLDELAKKLKQKCGAGGTVKDGVVEIQGDHRETVARELIAQGFKAKQAGG